MRERIRIDGSRLDDALTFGRSDTCLDLETGTLNPLSECPPSEIGEGRRSLREGKRFIRIPTLDEIQRELKARYDRWDRENAPPPIGHSELEELDLGLSPIQRWDLGNNLEEKAKEREKSKEDKEYEDFNDYLHEDLAAEGTALRWIANLQPPFLVEWFEEGIGVTKVYDPQKREWVDVV